MSDLTSLDNYKNKFAIDVAQKIFTNKKMQAKLSWKRSEALQYRERINSFINDNFGVDLPKTRAEYKLILKEAQESRDVLIFGNKKGQTHAQTNHRLKISGKGFGRKSDVFTSIENNYSQIVKTFYSLGEMGLSVAALYEHEGKIETYTLGHLFSKNRVDPVWNYRKSQLIRSLYRKYLFNNPEIIELYHPIHLVLTLPHKNGIYQGKKFYAKELLHYFRELRRSNVWKKNVFAGEYGVEATVSENNGFHIHLHSLVLLRKKYVKPFREELQKKWNDLTGAEFIHAETLYFYKKDEKGKYISEVYTNEHGGKKVKRIKFYVNDEMAAILKSDLPDDVKQNKIIETYTRGILECIKYHFKGSEVFDDIDDLNEVLENTAGKRLYSRFGAFYKEKTLNFNQLKDGEVGATITEIAINPHTGETHNSTDVQLVSFYPQYQRRQPATSIDPFALINNRKKNFYTTVPQGMTVKSILKIIIEEKFKKDKNKYNGKPDLERERTHFMKYAKAVRGQSVIIHEENDWDTMLWNPLREVPF